MPDGGRASPSPSWPSPRLFQIVDGAQAVAGGMLRGLHDTQVPMIYAAIGYWGIGLPLGVVLAFRFDSRASASGSACRRASPSSRC